MRKCLPRHCSTSFFAWHKGALAVVGAALLFLQTSCGDKWNRSFDPEGDGPHDVAFLLPLLEYLYPQAEITKLPQKWADNLSTAPGKNQLYFATAEGLFFDTLKARQLAEFVHRGGTAFLAAEDISNHLLYQFMDSTCVQASNDLTYSFYLSQSETLLSSRGDSFEIAPITYLPEDVEQVAASMLRGNCYESFSVLIWRTLPVHPYSNSDKSSLEVGGEEERIVLEDILDEVEILEPDSLQRSEDDISYSDFIDEQVLENYEDIDEPGAVLELTDLLVHLPFGEGHVLFYASPILLTNAYLADPKGRPNVEQVLSYLPQPIQTIFFDVASGKPSRLVRRENQRESTVQSDDEDARQSILREVLTRPSLATAWYMLLFAALVFVIFGAKRRQRMVPVVQARRNTTLDHLGGVSRLYLAKPNNALMARKQFALFDAFCIRKFGLRPLHDDQDAQQILSMKGLQAKDIESLMRFKHSLDKEYGLTNESFVRLLHILSKVYSDLGRRSHVADRT